MKSPSVQPSLFGDHSEETPPKAGKKRRSQGKKRTAERMAQRQREISISEFFSKNRHLLGFDNPKKALLTSVKEAVDNSLDACEEAGILPEVKVAVEELTDTQYRVVVEDNGPGIVKAQIPKIFGKLLYGSKFHSLKQQRGQQGIGISAAGMYGQLTTGRPIAIVSRTEGGRAYRYNIHIDTRKNRPQVTREEPLDWQVPSGTRVSIDMEAVHKRGRHSVEAYLRQTGLANPHARITYRAPDGQELLIERSSAELPVEPKEIKPHPYGVELGILMKMLAESKEKSLGAFLRREFSRISPRIALEICRLAEVDPNRRISRISRQGAARLYEAIPKVKIMAPPTNCLSPIGEDLIKKGLEDKVEGAEFFTARTRAPAVYRGNPFQVEAGLAFGGDLPADEPCLLYRFANRVPLQYQQSACAMTKAVISAPWRNYSVTQPKGALPRAPMIIMVHVASVWVPFTSESKEAVAHYPEILKELKLALMECGRKLGRYLSRRRRSRDEEKKRSYIETYLPHIGIALREILHLSEDKEEELLLTLRGILERSRTHG